jgi:hypothetical protein
MAGRFSIRWLDGAFNYSHGAVTKGEFGGGGGVCEFSQEDEVGFIVKPQKGNADE